MTKTHTAIAFATLLGLAIPTSVSAQQPDAERQAKRAVKLQRACRASAGLRSLAFSTEHRKTNDAAMAGIRGLGNRVGKFRGKRIRSSGVWSQELLSQTLSDGESVVFHGRRMIAMDDDTDWTRRHGHRANGKALGFVLDPQTLFATLAELELSVVHHEVGAVDNKPVEIYTTTLHGDDARNLLWSGSIPTGSQSTSNGGAGNFARMFIGGQFGGINKPKISLELAISFDPGTGLIRKLHGRSITQGGRQLGGRIVINGGGIVQGDEEDDDEEEEEPKPGTFKNSLPVHAKAKLKSATVVEFTYEFRKHNDAAMVELDARARRLLGLPAK